MENKESALNESPFPVCDVCSLSVVISWDGGPLKSSCGCDYPPIPLVYYDNEQTTVWFLEVDDQHWKFRLNKETGVLTRYQVSVSDIKV